MPSKIFYHIKIVEKTESVLQRMLWKVWFFLKEQSTTKPSKETYCFKLRLIPKQCNELEQFKEDLFDMVKIVEFNNKMDQFQAEVKNDINKMKQCTDILVFPDKTSNIYTMNTKDYHKLLRENIIVT